MMIAVGIFMSIPRAGRQTKFCYNRRVFLMAGDKFLQVTTIAETAGFIGVSGIAGLIIHKVRIIGIDVIGPEEASLEFLFG